MRRRLLLSISFLVVSGFLACGPKVTVHPMFAERSADVVTLLPSAIPDGVQRERVAYFRDLLRLELDNAGFVLLDDSLVRAVCSTPACEERNTLTEKYKVKGFFQLEIDSTRRVNFLAGYYNAVSGNLAFHDWEGEELIRVEHTQSSQGGLVFESGQIIQGVINQVRNSREDPVNEVGAKFVRTLVREVPGRMKVRKLNSVVEVDITEVKTRNLKPSVSEVCVHGTKGGIAALVLDGRKSTLRQTEPGTYCGIFRLENDLDQTSGALVELRSPYGTAVRRAITVSDASAPQTLGRATVKPTT